ncbi:hypothetical protein [Mesorhizobium sp. WSM3864]|uniref:hypothetical protein n=1 Tax=Mesorhizobium sp. WSM3864 TaxID=2029404 RepID=UPI0011410354|nr:hypothetical protein [Mesorhizobium sp. WSM3864]
MTATIVISNPFPPLPIFLSATVSCLSANKLEHRPWATTHQTPLLEVGRSFGEAEARRHLEMIEGPADICSPTLPAKPPPRRAIASLRS